MSKSGDKAGGGGGATSSEEAEELEQEKAKIVKQLLDEIEAEASNTERKERVEHQQHQQRRVQLFKTQHRIEQREKAYQDYDNYCQAEAEWAEYLDCNGLPDARDHPQLNSYLHLWSLEDERANMASLARQCEIACYLIDKLDDLIARSRRSQRRSELQRLSTGSAKFRDNSEQVRYDDRECRVRAAAKEEHDVQVRQAFRDKLQAWIDRASYDLLSHLDANTERVDLKNARYHKRLAALVLCFWIFIKFPISMRYDKDRKAAEVDFEEVGLSIKMPLDVDCYGCAVRALCLDYDHYSDKTASYEMPTLPPRCRMDEDLLKFCANEYYRLTELRDEQRASREERLEEKRSLIQRMINPPQASHGKAERGKKKGKGGQQTNPQPTEAPTTTQSAEPLVPQQQQQEKKPQQQQPQPQQKQLASPEEIVAQTEEDIRKETRRLLFTRCKKTEINLRKYAILGGIYRIDLLRQPPQPKDLGDGCTITTLKGPKKLEYVEFWRPYKAPPPAPDHERTPEVIEAEIKALEAAMELLVLVTIKLPDSVLWFEPPLVAHWLEDERVWCTEDVHDIKYNEEKQQIQFRTGRLGLHGLAACRYVNLPFQSWELKPASHSGAVALNITGAIIQLELLVKEDLVCLNSIVGGGTTLKDITGQFMKLHELVKKMRAAGCDVFPEQDASSYLKGMVVKHPVSSRHLQACMGLLSTAYVFSWSRWNGGRGPREMVMQLKEVHGNVAKERSNVIVLVTPFRTSLVNCSEVSPEFSSEPFDENDRFYCDIYNYALHNAGIKTRLCMKNISFKLSTTVTRLLATTNVLNMSV
uniref:IC97/Casc1 N-terminal domain-containing protein n=1 Tax=Trichogramma kaykai TaxID=54128 RepID=A0ABD2WT88_9HYME